MKILSITPGKGKLYEITLERKAVSRIIHTLAGEGLGIINTTKDGVWFDPER